MQISNSAEFLAVLERYKQVRAVSFGHVHQLMAAELNGIKLFSTPSTCFQFKPFTSELVIDPVAPGYRILELYEDGSLLTDCYRLSET